MRQAQPLFVSDFAGVAFGLLSAAAGLAAGLASAVEPVFGLDSGVVESFSAADL